MLKMVAGVNNANMSTPPDGSPGRMQMYVWAGPDPDRDGDFDDEIVIHEYCHGLSNRLVGGGSLINQTQTAGMGEGWSDFYGLSLLTDPTDDPNAVYASGAFASFMLGGSLDTNYYFGIRHFPYCTDLNKNPFTFKDIDPTQSSPHLGVPLNPRNSAANDNPSEVHFQGEVWCMMLWEARAAIVTKYGGSIGNELMLRLVTDGMKLCPVDPTFVQSRDAILQADLVDNNGVDFPELWAAFAKRGIGVGAVAPANTTTTGVVESFDLQDSLSVTLTIFRPVGTRLTGPISPSSQIYTLTNTGTSVVNWTAAKTQTWLALSAASGTLAPGATTSVVATVLPSALTLVAGGYDDTITFTNTDSSLTRRRAVALTINPVLSRLALFNLDADPQWTRDGQWAYGTPTGGGAVGNLDPTSGATGTKVFGVNLAGNYSTDEAPYEYLTSGPINLSGVNGAYLKFRRWLNLSSSSFASNVIDVSVDGSTWTNVWSNTAGINETAWSTQQYPLGNGTNNQSTVYIRWGHSVVSTGAAARGGMNLDDIEVLASTTTPALNAIAQTLSTPLNTAVNFTIAGLDASAPTAPLTLTVIGSPAHGAISGTLPDFTYTPATDYVGQDQLTFTATNGTSTSTPAAITFLVLPPAGSPPDIAVEQPEGSNLADAGSTVSFGNVLTGSVSIKRFRVTNTGPAGLTLGAITIDGANPSEFTAGALSAVSLPTGASAYFNVTFAPTLMNGRSAVLHLASDDPDESPFDIALTGSGTNLSGGVSLVRDINVVMSGLTPGGIVTVGSIGYFVGTTFDAGAELWRTDGTAAGTSLLKDIGPGTGSASITSLTNVNGLLMFAATNSSNGIELWKSDGTTGGTVMVKDINTGTTSSTPANFAVIGSTLYFTALDATNGIELWRSDGTTAGTVLVKDINPGSLNGSPSNLTNVGGTLFFSATDTTNGTELWKSDGTAGGTVLVKDINPGTANSSAGSFAAVGSTLFFIATDGVAGVELWSSDGTTAGTAMVKDTNAGAGGGSVSSLVNFGGTLFFAASDAVNGVELWKSDGTSAGTVMVADIVEGSGSSSPLNFLVAGSTLYFSAIDPLLNRELFKTDGTTVTLVADLAPNALAGTPSNLTLVGSTLYFAAYSDGSTNQELWKTDGTEAGTVLVKDILPGASGSGLTNFANVGGTLVFSANDGLIGQELWKSDGTTAGTVPLLDGQPGTASGGVSNLRNVNGTLFFAASDGVTGNELWKSNGRPGTTSQVRNIFGDSLGVNSSNPSQLLAVGSAVYFQANDGSNGAELWRSEGSSSNTAMVVNLNGTSSSSPTNLTLLGNTILFSATGSAAQGAELLKSDGSSAGTVLVKDINLTSNAGSSIANPVVFNGKLYFSATDGTTGSELWTSDGTTAGTTLVLDINAGTASSAPTNMRVVGAALFFTATTTANGNELWKTDGTAAGTVLVLDINAGTASSSPANLTVAGSTLYFSATNTAAGQELWKSDGTAGGTVLVMDIFAGTSSSSPTSFAVLGSTLYFSANTTANGRELWKSDGTAGTTSIVIDAIAGAGGSSPSGMTVANGAIYFSATGPLGQELWKSDGTAGGTALVVDIVPGVAASAPANFTPVGNQLFFTARGPDSGTTELFVIDTGSAADLAVEAPAGTDLTDGVSSVNIGVAAAGGSSVSQTFLLKNTGGQSVTLTGFTIDGPDAALFSAAPAVGGTIIPGGGSIPVSVSFGTPSSGAKSAAIHFASNDTNENPFDIALTGTGVDAPEIAVEAPPGVNQNDGSSAVNIGDTQVGVPVTLPISVRNTGTSLLTISAITVDGANSAEFSVGSLSSIAGGASANLTVTFTPAALGSRRAALHIASDDADEASFDMDLVGIGAVAAGPLKLARDINQAGNGTTLTNSALIGSTLYFASTDSATGTELWKSDGTPAGTMLLKDINAGTLSSSPANLVVIGSTLYFTATDATNGNELWKSDGTTGGTLLVKDISTGALSSSPTQLINAGGVLYFIATDATNGTELWKSDGTSAGTLLIKDIVAGTGSPSISLVTAGNASSVFFNANDGVNGAELWISDGTSVGTFMVKNINVTAGAGSAPAALTMFNSLLYFSATDGVLGTELWRSDGTSAGTTLVLDINPGSVNAAPATFVPSGSTLFFVATNSSGGELWKTDGTASGTLLVRDISPGSGGSGITAMVANGVGGVFFGATDVFANGSELWKSDGTVLGTQMVRDINPGSPSSNPTNFAMIGGVLYFNATTVASGAELWRSDGTAAGTYALRDLNPGALGSAPSRIMGSGSTLFFVGSNGADGSELWSMNAAGTSMTLLRDFTPGTGGSSPTLLRAFGDSLFFLAVDSGATGQEPWLASGAGVAQIKDVSPGSLGSSITTAAVVESTGLPVTRTVFFNANNLNTGFGTELWKSDGSAAGTQMVLDINPGSAASNPVNITAMNGRAYFTATDGPNGAELWTSDGTAVGTQMVANIMPGSGGSSPASLTVVGDKLFFVAGDLVNGGELWMSDGTFAGTNLVKDITPGSIGTSFSVLTATPDRLFFSGNDGTTASSELWVSDGTADGTYMVRDINPTAGGSSAITVMVPFAGQVYFNANDGVNGTELWRSDGTAGGTVMVKDITPGVNSSTISNFVVIGSTLYFSATDGSNGAELWKSDGSTNGTMMVKDIFPGSAGSSPASLTTVGGILYFNAFASTTQGAELWRSDGTLAGTQLVLDMRPGTGLGSAPGALTAVGNRLYFTATGNDTGIELWWLETTGTPEIAVFDGTGLGGAERQDNTGSFDFGALAGPVAQTFTITNTSDTTLHVANITVSGLAANSYTVTGRPDPAQPIVRNATATFTVTASPNVFGTQSAVISILSDDTNEASFEINVSSFVSDGIAPIITAPATQVIGQPGVSSLLLPDLRGLVTYTDNLPSSGTITQSPAPGSSVLNVGQSISVSFTAMDAAGNTSNTATTLVSMGLGEVNDGTLVFAGAGKAVGADATLSSTNASRVVAMPDGGYIVGGTFVSTAFTLGSGPSAVTLASAGSADVFLARYQADGTLLWARKGGSSGADTLTSLRVLADGSIAAAGTSTTNVTFGSLTASSGATGTVDFFVVRYLDDGTPSWVRCVGGVGTDTALGLVEMGDGSLTVVGLNGTTSAALNFGSGITLSNFSATGNDWWLANFQSSSGITNWARAIGGASSESATGLSIAATPDGGVALAGAFLSATLSFTGSASTLTNTGVTTLSDLAVVKYDSAGALLWAKSAGGGTGNDALSSVQVGQSLIVLPTGDLVIGGTTNSTTATFGSGEPRQTVLPFLGGVSNADIYVASFSGGDGSLRWAKQMGSFNTDVFGALAVLPDNSVAITGSFSTSIGYFGIGDAQPVILRGTSASADVFVSKLRADTGALVWVRAFGGNLVEAVTQTIALRDGDIGVAGTFTSATATFGRSEPNETTLTNASASADLFVAKFSREDGSLQWAKRGGGTGAETVQHLAMLGNGSAVLVGTYQPVDITFGSGEPNQTTLTNAEATGTNTDLYIARFNAGGASTPGAPQINSLAATGLSATTITFNTSIASRGADSTVTVEYGPTTGYGSSATLSTVVAGAGAETRSLTLTGLTPSSVTNFRVTATNSYGTTVGSNVAITTFSAAEIAVEENSIGLTDGTASIDFGHIPLGSFAVKTFTVRNVSATAALTGLTRSVDGTAAANFVASALSSTSLAQGASTTITVTYTPSVVGLRTAALHFTSNDGDESPFDIALSGDNFLPATFPTANTVPVTANGYSIPSGITLNLQLGFAPVPGTTLKLVDNTSANPISGTLLGVPQNGIVTATFGGRTYYFHVSYTGGDGNDIVLGEAYEWSWVKGSTGTGSFGLSGTVGVPSVSNTPSSRQGAATWTDASGNLWLFGGQGVGSTGTAGYLNDVWKYSKSTNQWVWLKGNNSAVNTNGTYGTLGVAASANTPGSRSIAATWIDSSGKLWLFGGQGYPITGTTVGYLNDLWSYDPATNNWTWKGGTNTINSNGIYGTQGTPDAANLPGGRNSAYRWIDSSNNLWLYGGLGYPATGTTTGSLADLWRYNTTTGQWTWMHGPNALNIPSIYGALGVENGLSIPGSRNGSTSWVDAQGRFYLFGGNGMNASAAGYLNDLWRYNPANNTWTWMAGGTGINSFGTYGTPGVAASTISPGARWEAGGWADPLGRFWIFGGLGYAGSGALGDLADLWTWNPATSQWTFVRGPTATGAAGSYAAIGSSPANFPGARERNTVFTGTGPATDLWLFGGFSGVSNWNDLWSLDLPSSPSVITLAASPVSNSGATLRATVSASNFSSRVRFRYGTDPTLTVATTTAEQTVTTDNVTVTQAIAGLNYSTTYYYQVLADNFVGSSTGSILSFATLSAADILVEQPTGTSLASGATVVFDGAAPGGSTVRTFTLKNSGNFTLFLLGNPIDGTQGSEFAMGALPFTEAAGDSVTFSVTFSPTALGNRTAALHLRSNDPDETPFDINLTGTGLTPYQAAQQAAGISGTANPTGDADSDGISNVMELAFGTNPGAGGSGSGALQYTGGFAGGGAIVSNGQPIVGQQPAPNTVDVRAIFVRRKDASALGLSYTVQFSANMTTWQTSTVTPTVLADDGTYQVVSVPYPFFIGTKKARFFHVVIDIAP